MASAVDSRLAYARLSAVATASRLPTATRGSNNSYTTSWDTTKVSDPDHSEVYSEKVGPGQNEVIHRSSKIDGYGRLSRIREAGG